MKQCFSSIALSSRLCTKKYYLKDYDLDDWMQEGRIVFNKCLQAYDENRGTTLGVLFKRSFENRVCSLLRLQQAQKEKHN